MNLGAGAIVGRAGRRAKAAGERFSTTAAAEGRAGGGREGEGGGGDLLKPAICRHPIPISSN